MTSSGVSGKAPNLDQASARTLIERRRRRTFLLLASIFKKREQNFVIHFSCQFCYLFNVKKKTFVTGFSSDSGLVCFLIKLKRSKTKNGFQLVVGRR
jgi:hypothetical protein